MGSFHHNDAEVQGLGQEEKFSAHFFIRSRFSFSFRSSSCGKNSSFRPQFSLAVRPWQIN